MTKHNKKLNNFYKYVMYGCVYVCIVDAIDIQRDNQITLNQRFGTINFLKTSIFFYLFVLYLIVICWSIYYCLFNRHLFEPLIGVITIAPLIYFFFLSFKFFHFVNRDNSQHIFFHMLYSIIGII